jgi:predicted nucleic acid-binding Zn ribbon protein
MAKKKKMSESQRRSIRAQQIVFSVLAILIILSMVVSLVAIY